MRFFVSRTFCGVTAAAAVGILTNAAPAQAHPPAPLAPPSCSAYQFPGGTITLNYPGLGRTVLANAAPSTHIDSQATTFYDSGTSLDGSVTGDINGSKVHLTVTREGYTPLVLDGTVDAGMKAHGNYTYRKNDSGPWDSSEEFVCAAAAPGAPVVQKNGFVVGGPVPIYNIMASEVPDQYGHSGMQIGTLEDGQLVVVAPGGPCAQDSWCKIVMPGDREHFGFVNGHIQF